MSTRRIASRVINRDRFEIQCLSAVNAENLHGRVQDLDVADSRGLEVMSIKEFGLGLATIAALSVPPAGSVTVEDGARGSFDGDVGARDGDEGAGPFFVAEGSGAFEDDLVFLT